MEMKIRKELLEIEDKGYATETLVMPENGVDCYEGCNPYGFPDELRQAMKDFDVSRLGPYPHSQSMFEGLKEYWKNQIDLESDNLGITDGSIAAIYVVNELFNIPGAKVLGMAPQFTSYEMDVKLKGMEYEPVYMKKENNYRIDVNEILERITSDLSVVYIDNPNNPTGQIIAAADIERVLKKAESLGVAVIVDEAYGDLMDKDNSAIWFLGKYKNMIMLRTMSKGFGLAGLRIGYILAHKEFIMMMRKIRNPYQVSEFAREMAGEALKHSGHIADHMADFAMQKKKLRESIGNKLHMAETCDTVSICMLYHDDPDVNLTKMFFDRGILVVDGDDFDGLDTSCSRIRMPRMEEFDRLLAAAVDIDRG